MKKLKSLFKTILLILLTILFGIGCATEPVLELNGSKENILTTTTTSIKNGNGSSSLAIADEVTTTTSTTTTTIITNGCIQNGSFENDLENWKVIGNGTLLVSTTESQDGVKSGYFETLTTTYREVASNLFEITSGNDITVSGYFKTLAPVINTKVSFKIYYYTDTLLTQSKTPSYTFTSSNLSMENVWEKKEFTKKANEIPNDVKYCKISIRICYTSGNGTNSDKVYFDNICIKNDTTSVTTTTISTTTTIKNEITTTTSTTIGMAIDTTTTSTTTTIKDQTGDTTDDLITTSTTTTFTTTTTTIAQNLIVNGSFEDETNGWNMVSNGSLVIETSDYKDGFKSVKFNSLTSTISGREVASNIFKIDSLKDLDISGWFKTTNPIANTKVSFKIWYYKDMEGLLPASTPSYTESSSNLQEENQWIKRSYLKKHSDIPTDAISCKISIRAMYVSGIGNSKDTVFIDDIVVNQ